MYCSTCGNKLDETHLYCPVCGTRVDRRNVSGHVDMGGDAAIVTTRTSAANEAESSNITPNHAANMPRNYAPLPSQSWLRFLTSIVLPLCTLILVAIAASLFFGLVYIHTDVSKARVYGAFPAMETVDKGFAAGTLALAILCSVTRKSLKWHRTNAVALATAFSSLCVGLFLLYGIVVSALIGRIAFDLSSLVIVVTAVCLVVLNLVYLNKRRSLFVVQ